MKRTNNVIEMEAQASLRLLSLMADILLRLAPPSPIFLLLYPSGADYYRQFLRTASPAESQNQCADDHSGLPDLESESESEIEDPWDPELIRLSENPDTSSDAEFSDLPGLETDSETEIEIKCPRFENSQLSPDDNDAFELIETESNSEIKQKGAENTSRFNLLSESSESLVEDREGFVFVPSQSNPEMEAKNPIQTSRFIQNSKFPLENVDVQLTLQALASAFRIYYFLLSQQRRLPLSIEYKRSENPETPRLSLPILNELLLLSTLGYYNSCQSMVSALTLNRELNSISFLPPDIMWPVLPNFNILPFHGCDYPPVEEIKPEPEESVDALSNFDLIKNSLFHFIDIYDSQTTTAREVIRWCISEVILQLSMPIDTFLAPQPAEIFGTYPTMPAIENPHPGIGAAAEDRDNESHPETNPEEPVENNVPAPAQQGPGTVAESSAGLHRFGITAYFETSNCLRRFFGPAQSPGLG